MLNIYGNVFIIFLLGILIVFANMVLVRLVAPRKPGPEKNSTYECGEEPVGSSWINFNARFYLIAILFIIFDVEVVLVFPVVARFRDYLLSGRGTLIYVELLVFVGILFLGLVFAWKDGYLEWLRDVRRQLRVEGKVTRIRELMEERENTGDTQ